MKARITDIVSLEITAEQAIMFLNRLTYNETELMSSEGNRKIQALRHRLYVALGEQEAKNGS